MLRSFSVIAATLAIAFAGAALGQGERVEVLGFEMKSVDIYDKEGNPLGSAPASAFKLTSRHVSSDIGSGRKVGLPYQGRVVYVRRSQLKIRTDCVIVPEKSPSPGVVAGERASMGEGVGCVVGVSK